MGFWSRLKRTVKPGQHDQEIEEELQYHLAKKREEGYETRAAQLQFGNPTKIKEEARDEGILPWLESFLRDTRFALRQMRKTPLLTLVIVVSLALGIGANSAIFSLVNAALLKSLPVPEARSLRVIEWTNHGFPEALCNMLSGDSKGDEHQFQGSSISVRVYRDLAAQQHGFASLIGFSDPSMAAVVVANQQAEQFRLQYVSANFFAGLDVPLQHGRPLSLSDDRVGQPPVVILSDRFWRNHFASRSDVQGQVLRVNNVRVEVAGVAPPGFFGLQIGEWVDLYAPLADEAVLSPRAKLDASFSHTDRYWWVRMIGRLRPDLRESQAIQELGALFQGLVAPSGIQLNAVQIPKLIALPGLRGIDPMRADESRALWLLFLFVGLILVIVCANVANLLLSRAVIRQRESAVCLALGAAPFRLFRQYFSEIFLLALIGGGVGLLLSSLLTHALQFFIRADMNIGGFDIHANGQVLGFTCIVSLGTALLCGIAPGWMIARASVHEALKANSRTVLKGRLHLPRLLVIAQIALSFTVLIGAGLLGRSLVNLRNVNVGFNEANLIYASVNPWSAGYEPEQVAEYVERLRSRLSSIPGVLRVATAELRPLSGDVNMSVVNLPGRAFNISSDAVMVNHVSAGFFEALGVPLIAGRTFAAGDMAQYSDAVVVDDLFARRFYGRQNPIGEQFGTGPKPTKRYRIIGVVKSSRYYSLREAGRPAMSLPSATASHPGWRVNFVLRTAMSTGQVERSFRQVARTIDPAVPVIAIETQTGLIDSLLRSERLLSIFSGAFGLLATLLSAIGLLGLLAYMVARRRNEIGIRMALGASRQHIAGAVVKDAFVLLILGLAAGLPGAIFMGRMLKDTLFKLDPADPIIGVLVLATMMLVAALSSLIPAIRATRIDPMRTLQEE